MKLRLSIAMLLAAASVLPAHAAGAAPGPESTARDDARLNAWLDAQYETYLNLSPVSRTYAGDKKDEDKVDDLSDAGMAARVAALAKSVAAMKAGFDRAKLSPDAQISYDLWIENAAQAAAGYRFRRNDYVFDQMFGPQAMLTRLLTQVHRVDEAADMVAYVARIGGIARALRQDLARARINAAGGVRPPRFAYDGIIAQTRALGSGAPFDGPGINAIWADAQAKADALAKAGKLSAAETDRLKAAARKALLESWGPATREVVAWFAADRANTSAEARGVGAHPNGVAYYRELLAANTSTTLTADQVHQIGLDQVAAIKREMEAIKTRVGYRGSLQDFFKTLRDDPRFYLPNTDAGRQAYLDQATAYITNIRKRLPDYFGHIPPGEVIAKRVEAYREQPGASAHYLLAPPDGSRPGVFYVHLSDMGALPIWGLENASYHEAGLGHHIQFSIARGLTGLPKFRTQLAYNAYVEGWALYTEQLGKEMGGYQDPYSDFGRLNALIWRAIRLVLDTGLHSKGWSEEQAVRYFLDNSSQSESSVRAEVRRYLVMPGQATGYMIGYLKMAELRRKAEVALGPKFDIRGFHDMIIGHGALPLNLLERQTDAWIAARKAE